jgi:hypothetical protein
MKEKMRFKVEFLRAGRSALIMLSHPHMSKSEGLDCLSQAAVTAHPAAGAAGEGVGVGGKEGDATFGAAADDARGAVF